MPKIIRPKPIAPGARIVRLTFDDEVWELDAVEYMQKVADAHARNEKRLRGIIDAKKDRARASGRASAKLRVADAKKKHTAVVAKFQKLVADGKSDREACAFLGNTRYKGLSDRQIRDIVRPFRKNRR